MREKPHCIIQVACLWRGVFPLWQRKYHYAAHVVNHGAFKLSPSMITEALCKPQSRGVLEVAFSAKGPYGLHHQPVSMLQNEFGDALEFWRK